MADDNRAGLMQGSAGSRTIGTVWRKGEGQTASLYIAAVVLLKNLSCPDSPNILMISKNG
jgi:hypothetical protein